VNQTEAEANCNRNGGHLAAYTSVEEQMEVERFFIDGGWLLPKYHIVYWMGLRQPVPGRWNFTDTTIPSPSFRTYSHWGTNVPENVSEPNNYRKDERCGVANVTEEFEGAWGWADYSCNETFAHVCRIMRGWPCCGLEALSPCSSPPLLPAC
jgi:hypothetical protein